MAEVSFERANQPVELRKFIRDIPDYPREGVLFRDITPLLGSAAAFRSACDRLAERFASSDLDAVATIESRGFTFGAVIA